MSTPTWNRVDGPPPSTRAAKSARESRPAKRAPTWAPPTGEPLDTTPPDRRDPYAGVAVIRSAYTCLPRPGNDKLTACGRLLFLDAITVSEDPEQVTCMFCRMRLPGA